MRRRLEPLSTTKSNPLMFPWLTGNNRRDSDSEEHDNAMSDTDMDQVMEDFMMEMDMERPADFTHRYKAFSSDQLPESNLRLQIEFGVLMPQSALVQLSQNDMPSPLCFSVCNDADPTKRTNCGVLEFSAPEGVVYLPPWMFKQLSLAVGSMVTVRSVMAPKGTFCKIQPQSVAFLDISDPRAVLEMAMRNYVIITKNDIIAFQYNDTQYEIAIQEVKPDDGRGAVLVVETDLQVDFAPPVGYVEPDYQQARRDANSIAGSLETREASVPSSGSASVAAFKPFSGTANRLSSRPISGSVAPTTTTSPSITGPKELAIPKNTLVFSRQPPPTAPKAPSTANDTKKFAAFTGKSNKLQ